jgi:cytochrome c oxidase cbb3-type subunit 1
MHLNLQLYGWTSLPLLGWLFAIYQVGTSKWAGPAIWGWSVALMVGSAFWLSGQTTGKIFLDWSGGSLLALMLAQGLLWWVLAAAWSRHRKAWPKPKRIATAFGLLMLAGVPWMLAQAASPSTYPPFDKTTGGPTGASLLGSTLSVVALLLILPATLGLKRVTSPRRWLWWVFVAEFVTFIALEAKGGSHFTLPQIIGLGLLLPWLVWIPSEWKRFEWPERSVFWKRSMLVWWGVLILAGWLEFLPGVLDRMKFTNGLVAHAHLAMAGFTSSFGLLLLTLLGGEKTSLSLARGGRLWNGAVGLHVLVLMICGWLEGGSYSWIEGHPFWREAAFFIRFLCGLIMLCIAAFWWRGSLSNSDDS